MSSAVKILIIIVVMNEVWGYSDEEIANAKKRMSERKARYHFYKQKLGCWEDHIVGFTTTGGFSDEQIDHIVEQMRYIESKTCIRWVNVSWTPGIAFKLLDIEHNPSKNQPCSTVEYEPENSTEVVFKIRLSDRCFKTKNPVLHALLYALGLDREHQRLDRDCYVTVSELRAENELNFKVITDSLFEKWPYDKFSSLHYLRTYGYVIDRDEGQLHPKRLGNEDGVLSCMDVNKLNYRFCGAPDYCTVYPNNCKQAEEREAELGCKNIYYHILNTTYLTRVA